MRFQFTVRAWDFNLPDFTVRSWDFNLPPTMRFQFTVRDFNLPPTMRFQFTVRSRDFNLPSDIIQCPSKLKLSDGKLKSQGWQCPGKLKLSDGKLKPCWDGKLKSHTDGKSTLPLGQSIGKLKSLIVSGKLKSYERTVNWKGKLKSDDLANWNKCLLWL